MQEITRQDKINELSAWQNKDVIKVVCGVRRCGKSTLLAQYIAELQKNGVSKEQIISINLENMQYEKLHDYHLLHDFLSSKLCENKFTYIFVDEIQQCLNFEKVIDSIHLNKNVDIYITGSNAYMLSGELATLIAGRYVKIDMLPLSFKEYYSWFGKTEKSAKILFTEFLKFGSFPYISKVRKDSQEYKTYLEGIYSTILLKDVAQRENIRDISLLENIVKFLASSIGSPISAKKVADTLISAGRKISVNTVENYIRALVESYIFYKVDRFDIKGRQHLKTLGKYYIVDTGLRNYLVAGKSQDLGHILENAVYFELLRRYKIVNIGKIDENEIDFIVQDGQNIAYFQVCATLIDEATMKREITPLQKLNDNHPKFILSLDEAFVYDNIDGIICKNIVEWFLED